MHCEERVPILLHEDEYVLEGYEDQVAAIPCTAKDHPWYKIARKIDDDTCELCREKPGLRLIEGGLK